MSSRRPPSAQFSRSLNSASPSDICTMETQTAAGLGGIVPGNFDGKAPINVNIVCNDYISLSQNKPEQGAKLILNGMHK